MDYSMQAIEDLFFNIPTPLWLFDFTDNSRLMNKTLLPKIDDNIEKNINKSKLLEVNKATLELYEAENIEQIREKLNEIIPKDSLAILHENLKKTVKGEQIFKIELVNYTCSGKKIIVLMNFILPTKQKDTGQMIISTVDITENKELAVQNELLAGLPEANPDMVAIMDYSRNIKYINPKGMDIMNIQDNKNDLFNFLPKDCNDDIYSLCNQKIFSNSINKKFFRKNKTYVLKIKPFSIEKLYIITITDVTEIADIKKEKEIFYEAMQVVNQAVLITDRDGNIKNVNQPFLNLYDYSETDVIGKHTRLLNPGVDVYCNLGYTKSSYKELFHNLWESVTDKANGKWEGTVINKTKTGKLVWVRLLISAIQSNNEIVAFVALPINITKSITELRTSQLELYKTIADLAEMRDNETARHMRRVGIFSKLLAFSLGKDEKFCNDIEVFAPLHDIGKVGIVDSILLAERKLTEEEFEIIKKHTVLGYTILRDKEDLKMAAEITLNHHEQYDGNGYPNMISRDKIPQAAQITAIADVYDALRSKRPYKEAWTHKESVKEIENLSGSRFHPKLVHKFMEINKRFEVIYEELKDE